MADTINGVPIGDLPGIGSVPDDSMLVVEFLGKAYHMPGAVLRQMIQDVLDSMGDSVDDVTEARLTAAIETVLASGKYNGISPIVEVLDEEDGTSVLHVVDAFGNKKYPVEVKGARNAVQYVPQELTDSQKAQARSNIGAAADILIAEICYIGDFEVTVRLNGEYIRDYNILAEKAAQGVTVIGKVVDGPIWFPNGLEVPYGTFFPFTNASMTFGITEVESTFVFQVQRDGYFLTIEADGREWYGRARPVYPTFFLRSGESEGTASVEYCGELLTGRAVCILLARYEEYGIPVFCYQKDAFFEDEDTGAYRTTASGTAFTVFPLGSGLFSFEADFDGYFFSVSLTTGDATSFRCFAWENTAYQTAKSKGDDLEVEDGNLFLMSAGERINEGVPLPSGNVSSTGIDTIVVLDQDAFDALPDRPSTTFYAIRG